MTNRSCCRCRKDLTDAASMEVGIGPICRKLDNALLAKLIPADVESARTAAKKVLINELPAETFNTFSNVLEDLEIGTDDWRKTVKRIEWILSWSPNWSDKETLISIVHALGYWGLAALLSGEAATGLATVTLENGRLYLRGPRNKAGKDALKQVSGRKFHPAEDGIKASWSVPVSSAKAFRECVITHWPNFTGLDEALASVMTSAQPVAQVAAVPTSSPGWLSIKTPYNAAFVQDVKSLPYRSRRWNGDARVWEIEEQYLPHVTELVSKHYGAAL